MNDFLTKVKLSIQLGLLIILVVAIIVIGKLM